MFNKRKTLKVFAYSFFTLVFFPYNYLYSAAKKIINPNLSDKQKDIMFKEGTERPFTSELLNEKRQGFYHCANCGAKLFSSSAKFDSGTGWPSFFDYLPNALEFKTDFKLVIPRKEYHCSRCGGHHGHVFKDGPEPTGLRYCNNGLVLNFIPD